MPVYLPSAYKQTYGPLQCLTTFSEVDPAKPIVHLLHGYGASADDLFPLTGFLDPDQAWQWISWQAPLEMQLGPGYYGRAWFPIDHAALEKAMAAGTHRDLTTNLPNGVTTAYQALAEAVAEVPKASKMIMGGFSQGAMMSTYYSLYSDTPPDSLFILSGALLDADNWRTLAAARKIPFFQCHGTVDPLLPFGAAETLHGILINAGWPGEFHSFQGGHEIPQEIAISLGHFLKQQST